jgi:N-acetylneuraminic acid mutarotase
MMRRRRFIPTLTVSVIALLSFASSASGAGWRPEGSLADPKYALAATAGPEGTIFAIGGAIGASLSNSVEVYRPSTKQWEAGPALPVARYRHAAVTGGDGQIYVIGGVEPQGLAESVLALKPGVGAAWSSVAPLPTPRQLLDSATGTDGNIYVVGGTIADDASAASNKLEIYDPSTSTWSTGAPMPTPRYGLGVARGGDGRIYAIGGCNQDQVNLVLNVVEAYSPTTNTWTTVAPLPTRRCHVRVTESVEGLIYAIGGAELKANGNFVFTRRVDVYSPQQKKWWTVARTGVVHDEAAAATGRRRVFAIGGHTDEVESRPSACFTCD